MPQEPASAPPEPAEAFAAAYPDVAPALHAWAHLRMRGALSRRLDPDDLVQEIAIRACQRAAEFDPAVGTFRRWIFGFAYRVWLEVLRELGRDPAALHRRQGGDSVLPGIADSVTSVSLRVASDESWRAAFGRLEELPDGDRDLVLCVGLEGLSHAQAAAILGIAEDASRKRWQRLRERLRADTALLRLMAG